MFRLRQLIDLGLVILIFVAITVVWWRAGVERDLRADYERLYSDVGELTVPDPNKAYVRALETGDPLHFAWRCYFPANYPYSFSDSAGSGLETSTSTATEFVLRIRYRCDERGQWHHFKKLSTGTSAGNLGNQRFSQFLSAHWKRLRVERLGERGVEELPENAPATLLRFSVPDDLLEAARLQLDDTRLKDKLPTVLEYEFRRP